MPVRTIGPLSKTPFLGVFWGIFLFLFAQPCQAEDSPNILRIIHLWGQRQPAQAHALIDSLLPYVRAENDSIQLMELLGWRGRMLGALGQGVEAIPPLQETLCLAQALKDTLTECTTCRWLAVSWTTQGQYEKGGPYYDRLVELARSVGNKTYLAWGLSGQGFYFSLNGDEKQAQRLYRESIALFREQDLAGPENFVLQLLGSSLIDEGAFAEARQCYQRSGEIGREKEDWFLEGLSRSNLGYLESQLGDPQAGLDQFRNASRLFQLDGSLYPDLEARLQVAYCLVTLKLEKQAAKELAAIETEAKTGGFQKILADVLLQRIRLEIPAADPDQTIADLQAFLDGPLSLDADTEGSVTLALANALAERDGPAAALTFLQPRLDGLRNRAGRTEVLNLVLAQGRLQLQAGHPEAALNLLMTVADEADSLQLVGLELQALPPASAAAEDLGQDALAVELLHRSSKVWLRQRALPVDPHWREVYGAQSRDIYVRLAKLLLRYPPEDPRLVRLARAFDAVQVFKARTLEERLLGPGVAANQNPGVTLEELQREILGPDEILLDCFVGQEDGLVFQVSRDSIGVFFLPDRDEIGANLRLFHGYISDPGRISEGQRDDELVEEVVGTIRGSVLGSVVAGLPRGSSIIWSPDGELNLFPLALVCKESRPPISRIPSAAVLVDLRRRVSKATSQPEKLLAIGDPREDLPAIAKELADLRRFRQAKVQTSLDISDLASQLKGWSLLHFATHARADARSPWKSYLEIPVTGDSAAFHLDAATINRWRLPAKLVVLAGCESAGGRIMGGEGVQSLANAFLGAGVPAVLATLWPVDDAATWIFISRFYENLAQGQPVGQALASAQNDLAVSENYADPFFWSGFVLVGDGDLEFRLERRTSWHHYLYWALGLAVILVLFRVWRRYRFSRHNQL